MKEIVPEKRARGIIEEVIGTTLIQAAYAKNAPPGTTVIIAGEAFIVEKGGRLRGTQRKPYAGVARTPNPETNA